MTTAVPLIGIGYRDPIGDWIRAHLDRFDVLEVTVDHFHYGGPRVRAALGALARDVPIVAHGVGLSLGTDGPLDVAYVREVAQVIRFLGAPRYSEHLAFTKVPGLDLGNLLPLPKTLEVAEHVAEKARHVRALLPVPFDLENVSYLFDWPDSAMSDGAFLRSVCEASGAGVLLDVENLYVNAYNHGFDAAATLTEIPAGLVHGIHVAGGLHAGDVLVDSHDHPAPDGAFDLLGHALARFHPDSIVLERDERIDAFDEILADVARIRDCLAGSHPVTGPAVPAPRRYHHPAPVAPPLVERQRALLTFLTNPRAESGAGPLAGLDGDRLRLMRELSVGKRLDKLRAALPVTLAHLDEPSEALLAEFAATCPPRDIGRAENAQQFVAFLAARWDRRPPQRAFLPDLARIELALTLAPRSSSGRTGPVPVVRPAVRCPTGAQFLHCSHDVRALFGPTPAATEPAPREVWLVVLPPTPDDSHAGGMPRVIEVSADLYAALRVLDDWRPLDSPDPLGIGAPPDVAKKLVKLGILEVAA